MRRWKTTVYIVAVFLMLQIFLNIQSTSTTDQHSKKSGKFRDPGGKLISRLKDVRDQRDLMNEELSPPDLDYYQPECEIILKDAKSAIARAKSNTCKQEISNVACRMQNNTLFTEVIPRYCPVTLNEQFRPVQAPKLAKYGADMKPARICYLLQVHGRSFRQFSRLFKAIYNERHYFYIHVDKRSDYLQREITKALSKYPNVRLTEWRMSTIWGGASLLQMVLRAINDCLQMWADWDFFINLSGLDFPIETEDNLSRYLYKYRDYSFMKSHGRSDEKFIQKQGLNRVFVECGEHMWRLGHRTVPEGIKVTGGSDWLALNRELCSYSVNGKDALLDGLKHWYQYTLLPVESFFHTLSHNREKCHNFVDNNLRVTNWNRARGCKCQYKHIVDWCGCSPNDFFPSDMKRLQTSRPVFFARKFEESVNQEVVNTLDFKVNGKYPDGTPSLTSYWENTYDHEDGMTSLDDNTMTIYQSFARVATKQLNDQLATCKMKLKKVVTVEMHKRNDEFIGYVVTMNATIGEQTDGDQQQYQALVKPRSLVRVLIPDSPLTRRLVSAMVGSKWDVKELILRDWGGLIGAESSKVRLIARWTSLKGAKSDDADEISVTIVVIDPYNVVADTTDFKTPSGKTMAVSDTQLSLRKPLRSGKWKVQFYINREFASGPHVELDFYVSPLEYKNGRTGDVALEAANMGVIDDNQLNSANHNLYTIRSTLKLKRNDEKMNENYGKAQFVRGIVLQNWIDDIMVVSSNKWKVSDLCRHGHQVTGVPQECVEEAADTSLSSVATCKREMWSSYYPDPKSHLGHLRYNMKQKDI